MRKNGDTFEDQQKRLTLQINAMEQLHAEFLSLIWADSPSIFKQARERHDRLIALVDAAGGLDAAIVMHLFGRLEKKAAEQIHKLTILAQANDIDSVAESYPDLPPDLIANVDLIHNEAYKLRQSKQSSNAGKKKRLGHQKKQLIKNMVMDKLKDGTYIPSRFGDKAKLVREILEKYPEVTREATIYTWLKAWDL